MGAASLRKPCPTCNGTGIVPRARRLIDGAPDPFDTRAEELCLRCCGSGRVPDAGPEAEKPAPGNDGCCC